MNENLQQFVNTWVKQNLLTPTHVDCATAVMLKILDGKCKMDADEKIVMTALYNAVKHQVGDLLSADIHTLIAQSHNHLNEEQRLHIYEKRVLAESMISRPIMKAFKTMIREKGLFGKHI